MLDQHDSLLPQMAKACAIRVGFNEDSLVELESLLDTLGLKSEEIVFCTLRKIKASTYIGSGKLAEIQSLLKQMPGSGVVFDAELTPNQIRNLEKHLQTWILDRPAVIIEIFSRHARTREAKTQVALARLQYLLPRLSHYWTHFERQRGGSSGNRGMGETQIEVDRRLVKRKIADLQDSLEQIKAERALHRKGREDVLKAALVGYTNAGKSTLLNRLTQSEALVEDKLFATLDSSVRTMDPKAHPPIVLIDTVGFIRELPPSLVASFRSSLEELEDAQLLVHVVDASHPGAKEQIQVTQDILLQLGLETKSCLLVLNKKDALSSSAASNQAKLLSPGSRLISSQDPQDISLLREDIRSFFYSELESWELLIPYEESKLEAMIHAHARVETKRHFPKGTFLKVLIAQSWAKKLDLKRFSTAE